MNIDKVFLEWCKHKERYVKKSTFSAYVLLYENHIKSEFKNHINVSELEVQEFTHKKLEQGLSQKSIKDILIVFKMILRFGVKYNLMKVSTDWNIQYPTQRITEKMEVLSRQDQKKIMDYIKEHFTFRNIGIFISLSTGMRIGEVCSLTWEDIDTENQVIIIRKTIQRIYVIDRENNTRKTEVLIDTPKTKNSCREIPMTKDLYTILKPMKKLMNPEFYVLTNDEKPTEPRSYRSYYKNFMQKLNLPAIKFHGLRHSFATRCIEGNADYKTVSVLLGHSNISTTLNLYVHPTDEQKRTVINNVFKKL
ncbi:site-specific integrase [Chryseobacterium sp. MHB01]|uniref:tyrosine-type recombinase/integrase n=1 Tax=Chryseobacterium sp. MHB01 TaxID=3109433 RepID=UPI002AFEBAC3|nr:site-specific integrase [Chryseobacterium sp. MHB01]MEA1849239.1 site-specific integrase [Chryseobacterium sp. MHB01]